MSVSIVGAGMHPFGRFDTTAREMGIAATRAALDDASLHWPDVDFAAGGSRDGGHAGALASGLGLTGVPFLGVYNGCGTGGSAILSAANAIESGAAKVALAVGYDKHVRGPFNSKPSDYGLPAWYAADGMMVTTQFFALKIQRYLHEHNLDADLLSEIAALELRNGSITPHAWRRKPVPAQEISDAVMVSDPLTSYMFCSPNEGAAAVVLMETNAARELCEDSIEIKALEFRTRKYGTFEVFNPYLAPESTPGPTTFAAAAAFEASGLSPQDVDVAQIQDTEAGAALMHLAECGFCEHGEQESLIRGGELEIDGKIPINTDGGLLANGEPIGASGLRQIVECVKQLQGNAGDRQVPNSPEAGFTQVYGAPGISVCSVLQR